MRTLVKGIRELVKEASEHPGLCAKYPLQGPHPTPLATLTDGYYCLPTDIFLHF